MVLLRRLLVLALLILVVSVLLRFGLRHAPWIHKTSVPAASLQDEMLESEDDLPGQLAKPLPAGVQVKKDIAYGEDLAQKLDVYSKDHVQEAPVIVMVHGGGWRRGDKGLPSVIYNKMSHWVPQGYLFISVNYRMLPDNGLTEQAGDVSQAIAYVQKHAHEWGGSTSKLILMGHSAGAHLIAYVASSSSLQEQYGIHSWAGSVFLDSAALDVEDVMNHRHLPLYNDAFGTKPEGWKRLSPLHVLSEPMPPVLAVCSTKRENSCRDAQHYVYKAGSLGMDATVLEENLSHREINENLGLASSYTQTVDTFLKRCFDIH